MNKKNILIGASVIVIALIVVWGIFFRTKNIPLVGVIPEKVDEAAQKIEEQPIVNEVADNVDKIVTTFKKAVGIDPYKNLTPDDIKAIGGQEAVNALIKKYEQAVKDLQAAIENYGKSGNKEEAKPAVLLFVDASNQAVYLRKYDEAIGYLQDVFKYYDKSDIALINLAHIYERQEKYQQAIDTYLRFYKDFATKSFYDLDIMQDYISLGMRDKVAEYYADYKKEGYKNEAIEQYLNNN